MKQIHILHYLVILCAVMPFIAAAYADDTMADRVITDALGREVTLPTEVTSVLSTAPPTTMTIYLIAPELLIGWNSDPTAVGGIFIPDQYHKLPVVGGWFGKSDGNYESFIQLSPDVIFEGRTIKGDPTDLDAVSDRQKHFGSIPLLAVQDTANISGFTKPISFIGTVLNKKERADELIVYYQEALKTVKETVSQIPEDQKVTVYYAEGPDGLATDPSGSQHSMLIDYCGGKNVAETTITPGIGMTPVSFEQVMSWNPEVIIASDPSFASSVLDDPLWKDIPAVKSGRVYGVPLAPFSWFDRPPGTNQIPGLYWMLHSLYPEKYSQDALKEKISQFYSSFYGIELSSPDLEALLQKNPKYGAE
jgi:iron complex transport system substrate-binding protein